jgi:glycosyltransferase involved in cell wall biosynthesis
VLWVPGAVFVVLGYGTEFERLRARDSDPRFAARHFTLPAKHPDELIAWTASADVGLMRYRDQSAIERLVTPNKFSESLAAGTPVVAARDQPIMARMVDRCDLGAVADEMTPDSIAAAIRQVIDAPVAERAAQRNRIAAQARESWSWPVAERAYRDLVRSLQADASGR